MSQVILDTLYMFFKSIFAILTKLFVNVVLAALLFFIVIIVIFVLNTFYLLFFLCTQQKPQVLTSEMQKQILPNLRIL